MGDQLDVFFLPLVLLLDGGEDFGVDVGEGLLGAVKHDLMSAQGLAPPARRRIGAIAGRDAATDAGTTAAQANGTDSRRRPRPFALPGGDPPRATPGR